MSMNLTPKGERLQIAFFGKTNVGKSSLINAFTNQETSLVSSVKGTTTDPVKKAMELLPLGAITVIDTAGIDDFSSVGKIRVQKTKSVLKMCDIAILVVDTNSGICECDNELIDTFLRENIPFLIAVNKSDLGNIKIHCKNENILKIFVSAKTKKGINELKNAIIKIAPKNNSTKKLIGDLLKPKDIVVLVVPIDKSAPKGRLILPQQQTIRDVLEANAISIVVGEKELKSTLELLGKNVKLVVTDSQIFNKVSKIVDEDIFLTSFSILFARYKGNLKTLTSGAYALEKLENGSKILVCEGCTHHIQCDDIGTVKLPKWIREYTKKDFEFTFLSGSDFKSNISDYSLIIHCGGCMLHKKEIENRIVLAQEFNVPITNYGTLIAYINGILKRATEIFNNTT